MYCDKSFIKGEVYYKTREVYAGCGGIIAGEYIECPKCKHEREDRERRFQLFKGKCTHPDWAATTHWDYMAGEAVMEPQYEYCSLCQCVL